MAAASQCIFIAFEMLVSKSRQATACDLDPLSKKHCGTPLYRKHGYLIEGLFVSISLTLSFSYSLGPEITVPIELISNGV